MNDKQSILIVDDIPENLDFLYAIFETDYQIYAANSGEKALKIARSDKLPELILLDIAMPGMDGYEVCKILKADEKTKNIPVIFVTAHYDSEHETKGFQLGGVDFIKKPFSPSVVRARVKTHLDLVNARKTLEKSNQELNESNATKDKFFSIVAHDLKVPFNGLIGLTSLLENPGTMEMSEIQEMCSLIKQASENLFKLLEDLLTWSRLQMGKMEFEPTKLLFSSVVSKTVDLLSFVAENKGIRLLVGNDRDLSFFADEQMVNTILRNLISNAIKFTDKGGTVKVSIHPMESDVLITVEDEGIGIEEREIKKLFRIDKTHTTEGTMGEKGTGLGLILCKDLIEKNKGEISVKSIPGEGSTFSITLPTS